MSKNTIIFDWSGTLSNNFHNFYLICKMEFQEFGISPISKKEIRKNFTLPYMNFWKIYIPNLTKEQQMIIYERLVHKVGVPKLYPKVEEIISLLHSSGWQIFILSSDPLSTLKREVKRSGLSSYFTDVIGNVYEKSKYISLIIKKYNLELASTYYVGDTSGDVNAGKQANTKTIAISWGFQHKDILLKSNPDYLVNRIVEIEKVLNLTKSNHTKSC